MADPIWAEEGAVLELAVRSVNGLALNIALINQWLINMVF
jgi:hypothetical protein